MYVLLLSIRYLTSRIIPLLAVAAVALCVALVIVVVSVMSGFLDMVRSSGKTLIGDVVVSRDITGIPHYAEFIREIEALPEAEAASPLVETYGLLQMPYGNGDGGKQIETVQVWGIDPESFDRVTDYRSKLYWRAPSADEAAAVAPDDPRLDAEYQREAEGMSLRTADGRPGLVLGIEISPFNHRTKDGSYRTQNPSRVQDPGYFMPNVEPGPLLTLMPVTESGSITTEKKSRFAVVNEFRSGVYQIDAQRVLAPLGEIQRMLALDEADVVSKVERDENGRPKVIGRTPARATTIVVKAKPGVDPVALRDAVEAAYGRFYIRMMEDRDTFTKPPATVFVATWEQRLADLIGPVENERELMRTLFSIVYVVCAALVLAIFWSIVQEKTRDIGILRAIGAGRSGVLSIFLLYGLLIGVVGSIVGVLLAWLIVGQLNEIHELIGTPAPTWLRIGIWIAVAVGIALVVRGVRRASALQTVLWGFGTLGLAGFAVFLWSYEGKIIWDPSVYYFNRIPSEIDRYTALTTAIGGIVFSVIGSAIPAGRAADTDPVGSLRYG
jgi:lipoprotein-releasing system permease protein